MKKFFLKQRIINTIAIFVGLSFVVGSLYSQIQNQVTAQTPTGGVGFSGVITVGPLFCCNGIMFKMTPFKTSVSKLPFYIHTWEKQIPLPFIGLGLYQYWNYLPKNRVLGSAMPGGKCLNPANKCAPLPLIPPPMDVWRMGVTLR